MSTLSDSMLKLSGMIIDAAMVISKSEDMDNNAESIEKFIYDFDEVKNNLTAALATVQLNAIDKYIELNQGTNNDKIIQIKKEAEKQCEGN